jgi:ATP-dependent DNA ligase
MTRRPAGRLVSLSPLDCAVISPCMQHDLVPRAVAKSTTRSSNLQTTKCPVVNLPETARDEAEVVVQIEFREWMGADHLRHATFIGLRDDNEPKNVVQET